MFVSDLRYTIQKVVAIYVPYIVADQTLEVLKESKTLSAVPKLVFQTLQEISRFSKKIQISRPGKKTRTNSLLFPGFSILWEP